MDEIDASTLPTKAKIFYPRRETDVVLVPKSRNYPCDDLYKNKTTRIAMIDPTGFRNKNMKDFPIEHEIDLEQNKMYAKRLLAEITASSRPYKDAQKEAKRQKHFQWLYNLWTEAEYTVSKDRVRLMLKSLVHHDTTVLPMLMPHKDTKKQWSYVMYKRFMANKDELLFETQAMNHWPARIPWTIPFDLLRAEKLDATKMSQRVQALFTQILYNVPHTWNNTKLMELVDLGRKTVYEFQPNDRIRNLGDKFDYPESSIRTGFVFKGENTIEKEIEVEGSDTKIKKTKHVKFEVVVGWLDANVCYGWHNPATNGITRNAIHQCMSKLFHEIFENDKKEWEHVASVFAGVSVKITEYKPVTVPEPEHTGDAPQYDSQCHVLCVRPFGGPDHCHVSNIYFKNRQYNQENQDFVFGILNTNAEKELEHLSNNAEYIHEHHTIQPYVMQDRAKLAEHQLAHINVKAHSRHWILKESDRPLEIKRRISELLIQDAENPEQLLRNFKAARITFQDWDLLVSTMTDDENTAHTVITAVNYPHHHSHFPSLGSSFHSPVDQKKKHSDIIKLPEGVWYEIRYVSGSLKELEGDRNGHKHSVLFWDFEKDRKATTLIQNKIHEIKKQMYKELDGMSWPLNTPFHKALLTNGSFLELWQNLVRKMIFSLMEGQVLCAMHDTGDGEAPSVSLTFKQGLVFESKGRDDKHTEIIRRRPGSVRYVHNLG